MARWKQRPEGSTWGDFGPDDQIGRLNLITREKVLEGIAEVKEGRTFCLSLPLELPGGNVLNPRRHPPKRYTTIRGGLANYNYPFRRENPDWIDVVSDDAVLLHTQYSTQWDSFAHVGQEFDADGDGKPELVYYNGYRADADIYAPPAKPGGVAWDSFENPEARALGIQNFAVHGIQGRAVMIDLESRFGTKRTNVGYDDLRRIMDEDKVEVTKGDMVCFYTGFAEVIIAAGGKPDAKTMEGSSAVLDGRDDRLLQWITDSGAAALIADNYAVEALPSRPGTGRHPMMPLHAHCLFKLGVPLGEIWYLTELARWLRKAKRSRFLLTAPPLRLTGVVGSPATPIATA
ncbi:MAG: cyclase family protein [Alphaproteobacteria bacterium]|nr:cyclase family protein [Alphaproteobacteria bacterium]